MPDDETLTWFRICERRYSLRGRSKLTDTAAREQTFDAAMVQFEEMFKAAMTVTEFTRPVQLYYGLAQAGMAIAAAYSPDPWSFSSHGLKLNNRNSPLAAMTIVPDSDGGFQKVAAATGSPVIMGPVSLGALWASIPDLSRAGALPGSDHPVPLRVIARESVPGTPQVHLVLPADMAETPSELLNALRKVKTIYPGSSDWGIPMEQHAVIPPSAAGLHWQVTVRWPTAGEVATAKLPEFFDSVAAAYRYRDERYFWPQIGGSAPPSPLMMWWLLLYSFSILARYEPRRWVKMLDPGKSDTAALMRFMLNEALVAVPQLVLGALDGELTFSAGLGF